MKYYYFQFTNVILFMLFQYLFHYSIEGVKVTFLSIKKKQKSKPSIFKFQRNRLKIKHLQKS